MLKNNHQRNNQKLFLCHKFMQIWIFLLCFHVFSAAAAAAVNGENTDSVSQPSTADAQPPLRWSGFIRRSAPAGSAPAGSAPAGSEPAGSAPAGSEPAISNIQKSLNTAYEGSAYVRPSHSLTTEDLLRLLRTEFGLNKEASRSTGESQFDREEDNQQDATAAAAETDAETDAETEKDGDTNLRRSGALRQRDSPSLIILAFLPPFNNGGASNLLPENVFNSSYFPFEVDNVEQHNCKDNKRECLRNSILTFAWDDKAEMLTVDGSVELMQWGAVNGGGQENESVAREMMEVMKATLDSDKLTSADIQRLLVVISASGLKISSMSFDVKLQNLRLSVEDVDKPINYELSNQCVRLFFAEILALHVLQVQMGNFSFNDSGLEVLILTPIRGFNCLRNQRPSKDTATGTEEAGTGGAVTLPGTTVLHDANDQDQLLLISYRLLVNLLETIISAAEDQSKDRGALTLIFIDKDTQSTKDNQLKSSVNYFMTDDENSNSQRFNSRDVYANQSSKNMKTEKTGEMLFLQMAVGRRRLQSSNGTASSKPSRMVVVWLCVVLICALILSLIPLLYLTYLDDSAINSSKLFSPSYHTS